MNDLRMVSNKVLSNSDNALKKQRKRQVKEKYQHQLIVKHKNKLSKIKALNNAHLPDDFSLLMRAEHKNKQIVIDASSKDYEVAKQLTKFFWIRAIKNKGTQVTFQETKLGKQIMDKITPSKDLTDLFIHLGFTQLRIGAAVCASDLVTFLNLESGSS